ncbi:sialoadhesin [Lates calcarifer]|uniref:Sialoadhesin n=1 Tax=Lates calcarifer TaxID=8187 RepID=A0AAJ8BBD5_LATCA|nr:sialoadhesin [Lates calcarifer]
MHMTINDSATDYNLLRPQPPPSLFVVKQDALAASAVRRSVFKLQPAETMKATLLLLLLLIHQASAHSHASVKVVPNKSQFSEYDNILVSCEHFGSGEWTVWRYTTQSLELSQCGSGWGILTSSTCEMTSVKPASSGVYWCESKHRQSSNAVSITITGGSVILQSPVLPVMEGHDVTLHCKTKTTPSNLPAAFYKDGSLIRTEPTGHMTIHHVTKSDEGLYKCNISSDGESPPSWLLMKDDPDPVFLTVSPDSSQLSEYENLSLSCGDNSSSHGWRIKRFPHAGDPSNHKVSSCGDTWGTLTSSGCSFTLIKKSVSAVYWCESPTKQRSNSVSITVHGQDQVILQSPVLPVKPGENVTLHCKTKTTSNLPAAFYKDGSLIRTESTGHMTIHHVTKSDEGLYKCNISSHGESPPSWLFVEGETPPAHILNQPRSELRLLRVIRYMVVISPYLVSTVLMVSKYRRRPTERTSPVSMTTPPPTEDDERPDRESNDDTADVTTEHHF